MKKVVLSLALILSTLMSFSQNKDSEGHVLVSLWKTYEKARLADKPQDQVKALEAIKQEAAAQHLAWDYYDAASRYVDVRSSINWKDNSSLRAAFNKEIEDLGEPVALVYHSHSAWSKEYFSRYVQENKERLQATFNPEFHRRDGSVIRHTYSPALLKFIKNDYEYALWSLYGTHRTEHVKEYYNGKYPEAALVEYSEEIAATDALAYDRMGKYINKYGNKAVTMLARQKRLSYEFYKMRRQDGTTSGDYEAIRDRCSTFEKDRSVYTGDEKLIADCCDAVVGLIKELDSKSITAEAKDDEVTLILRNVKNLQVSFKVEGKTSWKKDFVNKTGSYYKEDTLRFDVPKLPDGDYDIFCKSGDCETTCNYSQYTLSMAIRAIDKGYGAFVADYQTGKPLAKCNFILCDADGRTVATAENVTLSGFTQLPDKLQQYLTKDEYRSFSLRASWTDASGLLRKSEQIRVRSPHPGIVTPLENTPTGRAVVLTDRGAYNPGEILHFKAILYKGTYEYELGKAGIALTATLTDPQGNTIGTKTLKTNEFGSIDGEFELVGGTRGGMYNLSIKEGGYSRGSRSVRVDEFVLPTFELIWDEDDMLYLDGDEVKVSGRVVSYSGHNLGQVKADYKVESLPSGTVDLNPDGTFAFTFKAELQNHRYGYPVTVTVTDATGETLEFQTYKYVYYTLPLSGRILNRAEGRYTLTDDKLYSSNWIVRESHALVEVTTGGRTREGLDIDYTVTDESGKVITQGRVKPGATLDIDLSGRPSGLFNLSMVATVKTSRATLAESKQRYTIVKAEDSDTALDMGVKCFFKELGGEDIALQFGSTDGPVWAVVELVGSGNVLLEHQIVTLDGVRGKKGSLKTVSYARKASWPETLTLMVLWFHKGECYTYSRSIKLPVPTKTLPLSFTRFVDLAKPGQEYTMLINTEPGVECAAAMFDKATEEIYPNGWSRISPYRKPEPQVYYNNVCGHIGTYWRSDYYYSVDRKASGARVLSRGGEPEAMMAMVEDSMEVMREESADNSAQAEPEVRVRDNFNATMAWEPALRSDKDGNIELKFTGCDRLSTYYVQLFAHTTGMRNAALREELKVTIPVRVQLVQPLFLYGGDEYTSRVTLSNSTESAVSGRVSIRFYDGTDYKTASVVGTKSAHVTIPAGGSVPFAAPYDVPDNVPVLGILVNFVADDAKYGSDAMFVTVPVKIALQTLTEAHSAVLLAGGDREALIAELRAMFVNADASALEPVERDILAMIREAIPDSVEPKSDNVLSLTEAYYSNIIARRVGAPGLSDEQLASIMEKIAACQNASGGISWFEGMESSPVVTAAILQRIAAMPESDTSAINVEAAVKYLDDSYFRRSGQPWWCGCLSLYTYLQTRVLYPSVPFTSPGGKLMREFKKDVKAYLVPSSARGFNGQILAKARRLRTLQSLLTLPDGKTLAKSWGLTICRRVARSYDADVESLLQYAVEHRCGGCYYPNAVMPWRGLMESELYAHSLLCDLFTSAADWGKNAAGKPASYSEPARKTAEGIRLWLMIQKETQKWETDAAYIEAIASVLRGTPETLATKVILLSTTFTKPFPEVKAAGNGFTVERVFTLDGKTLAEGDPVAVGDRIVASYRIWSEENRSFVRLTAPRPASMRPVAQLSGHYGWWLSPMSYGSWTFRPQGYRNVLSDKTEYWFDSYPEEHTTITEEFFVTQEGSFQMPAVEIESLYAPHYRANDAGRGALVSR